MLLTVIQPNELHHMQTYASHALIWWCTRRNSVMRQDTTCPAFHTQFNVFFFSSLLNPTNTGTNPLPSTFPTSPKIIMAKRREAASDGENGGEFSQTNAGSAKQEPSLSGGAPRARRKDPTGERWSHDLYEKLEAGDEPGQKDFVSVRRARTLSTLFFGIREACDEYEKR